MPDTPRHSFLLGVKDVAPVLLGVAPFGLVSGVAAVSVGIPEGLAFAMSFIVFAGASQVAAVALMGASAPVWVILLSTAFINLRMMMYSASLAPFLTRVGASWKFLIAYLLTDHSYAFCLLRFSQSATINRPWYYLGTALPAWLVWVGASAVGVFVGAQVPAGLSLEFTIPLSFLALLVPVLKDRASVAAALVGGGVAVLGYGLPNNFGLLLGALAGMAAGAWLGRAKP